MKFNREHKTRIQGIFEEKTGTALRSGRKTSAQNPLCRRFALLLALVLVCCFTTGGLAVSRFSSLEEDDLALAAVYEGDGIVQITVQNRSDKDLDFEEQLKDQCLTIYITPLKEGANVNVESAMAARKEEITSSIGEISNVRVCPVYEIKL